MTAFGKYDDDAGLYDDAGNWYSTSPLFRSLTAAEVEEFRAYARTHPAPDVERQAIMHPVCREVWQEEKP